METQLFNTSTLFTLSGDQKYNPKHFQTPEVRARLPLDIPKLTTDDLFEKKGNPPARKRKSSLNAAQDEALQNFAKTYKLDFTALTIRIRKGVARAHVDLESRIQGISGAFRHSLEVNPDGTIFNRQTKIKG